MDGSVEYENTLRDAVVAVLGPETKVVKEAWEEYINDNYDIKMKGNGWFTNKDVLTAKDVNIAKISDKNLNLFSEIVKDKNGTKMSVFVSFGYDVFLEKQENSAAYQQLKAVVHNFLTDFLLNKKQEMITVAVEEIADLDKDKTKMTEDIEKNKKEIEKLKSENDELAKEVKGASKKLVALNKTLTTEKIALEDIRQKLAAQKPKQ